MEYRCYRNVNKPTVVPGIKVGMTDFLYLIFFLFIAFVAFFLLAIFLPAVGIAVLLISFAIVFIVWLKLRSVYYRTGKLDVLVEYIDFFLEDQIIKGRER